MGTSTIMKDISVASGQPEDGQAVNILEFADSLTRQNPLELVRLDGSETAVIPFTTDGVRCALHFCDEVDIRGYVHCNDERCVLCKIGRQRTERILLPVYVPITRSIGVLPISTTMRPQALLPQFLEIMKVAGPEKLPVIFITRDGAKYTVMTSGLPEDADGGETKVAEFEKEFGKGLIDLSTVYQRLDNGVLADIPEISRMLELKGLLNE
jgi:hypothetical protein